MYDGALMILLRCAAGAARKTHMAWNWVELQQLLLASPCVRLVLSGHDHMGGYAQHGHVHFVTVEAMLEGKLWFAVHNSNSVVALYQHGKFHAQLLGNCWLVLSWQSIMQPCCIRCTREALTAVSSRCQHDAMQIHL